MIVLEGIFKHYSGLGVLRGADLRIGEGSIYGIIGKSGAGKSTLLRVMSLLERPDAGRILHRGEPVDNLTGRPLLEHRRRTGMIFQNFNLLPSRNAAENIALPLEIAGVGRRRRKERIAELLDLVGIADKADSPLSALSGGQKQRVAIARALASEPEVLFCDEATSSLDPQTTRSILTLLKDLHAQLGLTIVMVTHQMEVVRDICSEVAVLDEGRIVEQAPADLLFSGPRSSAARELLYA